MPRGHSRLLDVAVGVWFWWLVSSVVRDRSTQIWLQIIIYLIAIGGMLAGWFGKQEANDDEPIAAEMVTPPPTCPTCGRLR